MDRLSRSLTLTLCGVGLLMVTPGCKLTRPEVPPGRTFSPDGRQAPPLSFSSDGHPVNGAALANMVPDSSGNTKLGQEAGAGTGRMNNNVAGMIRGPGGSFGPPGTSGRPGDGIGTTTPAPRGDEEVLPAGAQNLPRPSIEPIPSQIPADLPDLSGATTPATASPAPSSADVAPTPEPAPAGSQVISPESSVGQMGQGSALPSPN